MTKRTIIVALALISLCHVATGGDFDKPWHLSMGRSAMLEVWARHRKLLVSGASDDMRYKVIGQTFYVSPSGNDSADGSKSQPWATLAKAVSQIEPGTVIYLRGGTYFGPVSINVDASGDAPAALRAFEGEDVTITYSDSFISTEKAKVFDPPDGKVDPRKRAVGPDGKAIHYPALITVKARFLEISGLHLLGAREDLPHNLRSENGIYFRGGGEGCRILYNEIEQMGHCGVKGLKRGYLIEGNYIHDTGHTNLDHGISCPADDVIIRRNIIINAAGWGIYAFPPPPRIVISHNIIAGNGRDGIILAGPDAVVKHNVFYKNNNAAIGFFGGGVTGAKVVGNIFVEATAMDFGLRKDKVEPSGNLIDYNCLAPPTDKGAISPGDTYGENNIAADPLFVDAERLNFQLKPNSPCLKTAQKTPQGVAVNMGIYKDVKVPNRSSRARSSRRRLAGVRQTARNQWRYQCINCGKEFSRDSKEVMDEFAKPTRTKGGSRFAGRGDPSMYRPTCPHCNAETSGVRMIQCLNPECKKYFITEAMKTATGGSRRLRGAKLVCPHCQTDQYELQRKRAIEARRKRGL